MSRRSPSRCDVENILFYNVGSVFAHATAAGVQFERVYAKPPEPPAPIQSLHYHRYELAAGETPFAHWRPGELIASFADVRLPRLAATTRVSEVWQALREAPLETATPQTQAALLVRLRVCSSAVGAATSFVKPLLDGVVSVCTRTTTHSRTRSLCDSRGSSACQCVAWERRELDLAR